MDDFYTYAYLRKDGTPYYIGKGRNKRCFQEVGRCCRMPKDKSRILFLKLNLTEGEAFRHEKYMIAIYGRLDLGTGILRNRSDGGEGASGRLLSEESRRKMSESAKRRFEDPKERKKANASRRGRPGLPMHENTRIALRKANTGKVRSESTKKKISDGQKGKKISPEAKEKMSAAKKGKPWTPARRAAQELRRKKKEL